MKSQPKYKIGDKVWYLTYDTKGYKVKQEKITHAILYYNGVLIYTLKSGVEIKQNNLLFPSK